MTSTRQPAAAAEAARERLLRIGEVVRRLRDEFPDISISKIRYLEDEGLLTPRRTQGGYRLFSEADLERLADDPAPAARRVPAAARDQGRARRAGREGAQAAPAGGARRGRGDRSRSTSSASGPASPPELAQGARGLRAARAARERRRTSATRSPTSTSPRRARSSTRFGVAPRHLRTFRTATGRQAALLEQLVAPALRGRNTERRAQAAARPAAARRARRASSRRCSSGATCETWRSERSSLHGPRGSGLPDARRRLQGRHAAARRPGDAARDRRRARRRG